MSRALQQFYNATLPPLNFWQKTEPHLQPTVVPGDSIASFGMPQSAYRDYDGYVKPRINPGKKTHDNVPRTALASAIIDDYGPNQNPTTIDGKNNINYVFSEYSIAKLNGRPTQGYDAFFPVPDPPRLDFPVSAATVDYDFEKEYSFNSHSWTTRDIPRMDRYPAKIDTLDFSQRINLYNPELTGQTSGADAWKHQGARDELDPMLDDYILDSRTMQRKKNGTYVPPLSEEARYRAMLAGADEIRDRVQKELMTNKIAANPHYNREDYFHPGIDFVTIEQARHGFSKKMPPSANPLTQQERRQYAARKSWEDLQNEASYHDYCKKNPELLPKERTNPW
jgi:hypothetical protein